MNTRHVKQSFAKFFAFSTLFLLAFASAAKAGLDRYEIYLNNKLILKQWVNQPLSLESLQLDQRNINDRLEIHYFQCNTPDQLGNNRMIIMKDAKGNKVKEWKFADAHGASIAMIIPVKELLQLEKKNAGMVLSLFYTADGHPQAQKLTSLMMALRSTTNRESPEPHIAFFIVNKFIHS